MTKANAKSRLAARLDGGGARRRGRPTPAETAEITQQILAAATQTFANQEFEDVSIEAVAACAQVKKDTIYKRYQDKRVLLQAVLQTQLGDWTIGEDNIRRHPKRLADNLKAYAVFLLRYASSAEGRKWIRLAESAWPGEDQLQYRRKAIGYDYAFRVIGKQIRLGTADDDIPVRDPDQVATALMAMLSGLAYGLSSTVSKEEVIRIAHGAVDLLIDGRDAW